MTKRFGRLNIALQVVVKISVSFVRKDCVLVTTSCFRLKNLFSGFTTNFQLLNTTIQAR